jgi:hypothetical protein
MATHQLVRRINGGGALSMADYSATYTGTGLAGIDGEAIPGSATTQFIIAIDVSAVQSFFIVSSVAATLKTNSSGSPANTVVLKAGIPYVWNTDSYDSFLLTTDVTSMFFVVAGSTAGTVSCGVVTDASP